MSDEYEVNEGEGGALGYAFVQTSTMKKGSHIIVESGSDLHPCKVVSVSTSKPGKHGSAKCQITAIHLFNGKKMEMISPAHATIKSPIVKRVEYGLSCIQDGYLELMDNDCNEKNDVRLEGEFGDRIQEMYDQDKSVIVTILSAMGDEMIVDCKEETKKD